MNWVRLTIWIVSFGMGVAYSSRGMDGTAFYAASMVIAAMGWGEGKL
jgi:hypothetical protein